jgi:UDP-N-acetylglucosamine 2-epimerase
LPSILDLIRRITSDEKLKETIKNCDNPFGDGYAGPRVANLLAEIPIDDRLLNKDIAY